MKVLLLAHGGYLDRRQVVSGNSVRAYFLARGLVESGIQVVHVYPEGLDPGATAVPEVPAEKLTVRTYRERSELARLIDDEKPDALLVGYWELMEVVPDNLTVPIVVDLFAPRVLEAMYQTDRTLDDEIPRLLRAYRRADRFVVGSERQRTFLFPWLILAGVDCRTNIPIDVIPISSEPREAHRRPTRKKEWRFVSGGVTWPWRRSDAYYGAVVRALEALPAQKGRLLLLSGNYPYFADRDPSASENQEPWPPEGVTHQELLPYGQMEQLFADCDVGLELAERNIERECSQSFRAIELLRCGVPLLCNDYLELAEDVARYDAGWVIHSPDDLADLVPKIVRSPAAWARKSANAIRLVGDRFHYRKTIEPLVQYFRGPERVDRRPPPMMRLSEESTEAAPETALLVQQRDELVARTQRLESELKDALSAMEKLRPTRETEAPAAVPVAASKPTEQARLRQAVGRWIDVALRRGLRVAAGAFRYTVGAFGAVPVEDSVIMVNRDDIFPADHGAAVRIDQIARGLSRRGWVVRLITDDRERYHVYREGDREESRFPAWLQSVGPERSWVKDRVEREIGVPVSESFLYFPLVDWSYVSRVAYVGLRHPARAFLAEGYPAFARACLWGRRLFGGKMIVAEHNVEYERIHAQYEIAPHTLEALRHVELLMCREADIVITVSDRDAGHLSQAGVDARRIHSIPHGVDLESFDRARPIDLEAKLGIPAGTTVLVYHGAYTYFPNLEAVQYLATEILPRLHARGCRPKVLALGRTASPGWEHDDVVFTGAVESVVPYLLASTIAVVPLRQGGGTRMKILDYFAAGLPVVSTHKGVEGMVVENGVHVLIDDNPDRMAEAVAGLMQSPSERKRLGAAGRELAAAYGWDVAVSKYLELAR